MNPGMDAVYLLTTLPHIVDCLMADLERRRYRRSFVIWTSGKECHLITLFHVLKDVPFSVLRPNLRSRLENSTMARNQIAHTIILNVDYFPRESHLITFRDPWSFPTLFHPACNQLVREHLGDLAQKVLFQTLRLLFSGLTLRRADIYRRRLYRYVFP